MPIIIRQESEADHDAVREVNRLAFDGEVEADLVAALRTGGYVRLSLVAELDGQVVGHILFSRLPILQQPMPVEALALAPLAVLPTCQKQGIGTMLVQSGLSASRKAGHRIVIVLGHPTYYPRFGFSAKLADKLQAPFRGESFMALELVPGAMDEVHGWVEYAPPFGINATGS